MVTSLLSAGQVSVAQSPGQPCRLPMLYLGIRAYRSARELRWTVLPRRWRCGSVCRGEGCFVTWGCLLLRANLNTYWRLVKPSDGTWPLEAVVADGTDYRLVLTIGSALVERISQPTVRLRWCTLAP